MCTSINAFQLIHHPIKLFFISCLGYPLKLIKTLGWFFLKLLSAAAAATAAAEAASDAAVATEAEGAEAASETLVEESAPAPAPEDAGEK